MEFIDLLTSVNAVPVELTPADWYTSLERGLAEGHFVQFAGSAVHGCQELMPYHTVFGESGCGMQPYLYLFNPDSFNSLPPDIQKIILDLEEWETEQRISRDGAFLEGVIEQDKEWDHTFIYLTPEEIKVWENACLPIHEKWIEEYEAKGYPAQAIYDEARRLIAEYQK